jgi:hypothetical protein
MQSIIINNVTDEKVQRAMSDIREKGGKVIGNNFSVSGVVGNYFLEGTILTITIIKKPFIVSMDYVDSELRKYFA